MALDMVTYKVLAFQDLTREDFQNRRQVADDLFSGIP